MSVLTSIPRGARYRILCDRVFDPESQQCAALQIDVSDETITAVAPLTDASLTEASLNKADLSEAGEDVFDLRGQTLIPPLVDTHVHVYLDPWPLDPQQREMPGSGEPEKERAAALGRMKQALLAGVGAIRDLGDPHGVNLDAADDAASLTELPHVVAAGAGLFREGRYGRFLGRPVAEGETLLDAATRAAEDPRVDVVKLIMTGIVNFKKAMVTGVPQFTLEECESAVQTAHDVGKPVAAHCSGDAGVRVAVEADVDFIEHGYFMSRETMDLLIERDLAWTPTIIPVHAQWNHSDCCGWDTETRDKMEGILADHAELVRYADAAGARILAGSDAGASGVGHGGGLWSELRLLEQAGLSAPRLLRMATLDAARCLGLDDVVGRIRPGLSADMTAFSGRVDEDLAHLESITWVIRAGRVLEAERPWLESDSQAETYGVSPTVDSAV